jgi:hypothetical protein
MLTASLRRHIQISGSFTPPGAMAHGGGAGGGAARRAGAQANWRACPNRATCCAYRLLEKEAAT